MIKTSSFLTGLTLFLATSFLPATVFAADLHNGMISVASLDGTQDVTILGVTLEADHEGTALLGSVFLSDKTEIGAGYSKSELTLLGSEFDEEIMFANAKYHFSRANLREGHGMGFFFAKPTTFENPMFKVGTADYYAVDHTPSYLWESASRAISAALIVYLPTVIAGRDSWQKNETIRKAINIDAGVIQNPKILSFQKRQPDYPHAPV